MEKLTDALSHSLNMGGNAAYVWPSFIIAAIVMACMVATSLYSLRKAQKNLAELQESLQNEA